MSNELAIVNRDVTPQVFDFIMRMAPVMHESRMFGTASPAAAAATMLKGYEIGIGITASFELIQVVQGRPALSPKGALAILHNAPEIEKITITRLTDPAGNFTGYECYMKRNTGFEFSSSFTMEQAKAAGLIKAGSAWANYPENMCRARAIGFTADVVAPDICAGLLTVMKAPEQYGMSLSESGDIIDMPVSNMPQNATMPPVDDQASHYSLEDAVNEFGPEALMNANGGTIPADQNQIDQAIMALKAGK